MVTTYMIVLLIFLNSGIQYNHQNNRLNILSLLHLLFCTTNYHYMAIVSKNYIEQLMCIDKWDMAHAYVK